MSTIQMQGKKSVHRYWVDELQEFNAALSGRFRESGLTTGQVLNRYERRNLDVNYYIKDANKYKSRYDDYRITGYRHHKLFVLRVNLCQRRNCLTTKSVYNL